MLADATAAASPTAVLKSEKPGQDHAGKEQSPEKASVTRRTLDMLASVISPAPEELVAERREHVQMFNLFGDPLLSLQHGMDLDVQALAKTVAGETLEVVGNAPLAGKCVVELVAARGLLTSKLPARREYAATPQAIALQNGEYDRANDRRWASSITQVETGPFRITVQVPPQAAGAGHVCVFIEGEKNFALGAVDIAIEKAGIRQAKNE
jgi:hypothetical protein